MRAYRALLTIRETPEIDLEIAKYMFSEGGIPLISGTEVNPVSPYYFSGCAVYVRGLNPGKRVGVTLATSLRSNLETAIEKLQGKFPDLKQEEIEDLSE